MADYLVYKPDMYVAEHELAFFLSKLVKTKVPAIPWNTEGLLHKQPEAVINACTQSVSILTGPPGTGKTTTLRKIVDSYIKAGLRGIIVTPTGKAAKRADEVVNKDRNFVERVQCSTTHAALEYEAQESGFKFNRFNRWKYDFVIMDEFSMQECLIMRDFVEAIKPGLTRLVFCGDQYQLPSIGPGNVARDLVNSQTIPNVELDVVLRTGPNSGISHNASLILRGQDLCKFDPVTGEAFKDFFFVPRETESDSVQSVLNWITIEIPEKHKLNPLLDIQLLCPGKNGLVGTKNFNRILRDALNPKSDSTLCGYRLGDKVINNRNTKPLSLVNGDVGFVKDIVRGQSGSHMVVDFGPNTGPNMDGITQLKPELVDSQLKLAYALTVHKAQGSEYQVCIMPVHPCHTILLTRPLVYTGPTRGKQLSLLVGSYKTMKGAIRNTRSQDRQTRLQILMQKLLPIKSVA